jgi:hypothetical protein
VGDLAADQGHHGLDAGDRAHVVVIGVLERRRRVDGDRQTVPALAHGEAVGGVDGRLRGRGLILLRVARGGDEEVEMLVALPGVGRLGLGEERHDLGGAPLSTSVTRSVNGAGLRWVGGVGLHACGDAADDDVGLEVAHSTLSNGAARRYARALGASKPSRMTVAPIAENRGSSVGRACVFTSCSTRGWAKGSLSEIGTIPLSSESTMPKITVDGRLIEAKDRQMILQACLDSDVNLPYYCYHPGLSIVASCRICLVEVEGIPKLVPSCQTPVRDGMVVHTKAPRVVANQKQVMEYLLVNHPLDCPVCDQAGECGLQDYSYQYGRSQSRFEEDKAKKPKKDVGKNILLYNDRCIMCTRCVRFTREVSGAASCTSTGAGTGGDRHLPGQAAG